MDGIIVVTLICLQLVSFFFIVILFAKLNKFKDLERKQEQVVEEMDAALAAYLMEMKEENDRLIKQLSDMPKPDKQSNVKLKVEPTVQLKEQSPVQPVPKFVSPTAATSVYKTNIEKQTELEESALLTPNSVRVETKQPMKEGKQNATQLVSPEVKELSYEEMVVEMYKDGQSVEAIAKKLDKGKTEIELLIKFHT